MFNTNLNSFEAIKSIHFVGIGGIGISGLARILKNRGISVSGSDQIASSLTDSLIKEGIEVSIGEASNLSKEIDLVIYSTAVPKTNLELTQADQLKIPTLTYPEAVGLLTKNYQTISIAGSHGKTTTTSLASLALTANNQDPTVIVGAILKEFNYKNERVGESDFFILESCEYQHAFLNYHPSIIILNNIEPDHLDYFQNEQNYFQAYQKFIENLQPNGLIIANSDDLNIQKLIKSNPNKNFITFGKNPNPPTNQPKNHIHYLLKNNEIHLQNSQNSQKNIKLIDLNLSLPGEHNLYNATAVIALADQLKLDLSTTKKAVENFQGSSRRFELKGYLNTAENFATQRTTQKTLETTTKALIIDDYAHHPTEIKATLQAARSKYSDQAKILVIFQPHQYSRTKELLHEFAESFSLANNVIIPNIYQVRDSEADLQAVSAQILVDKINQANQNNTKFPSQLSEFAINGSLSNSNNTNDQQDFINTKNIILENIASKQANFDIIFTMGAGNITNLSDQLATEKLPDLCNS